MTRDPADIAAGYRADQFVPAPAPRRRTMTVNLDDLDALLRGYIRASGQWRRVQDRDGVIDAADVAYDRITDARAEA